MFGKTSMRSVVKAWLHFLKVYRRFRKDNGLAGSNYGGFELCTSLSDKHGRICRQIKHMERGDKKSDWPMGMTAAMTGYIVYCEMLLEKYGLDMADGLRQELESALKQYQKKSNTVREVDKGILGV